MKYNDGLADVVHKCSIEFNLRKEVITAIIENYYVGMREIINESFDGDYDSLPNVRVPMLGKLVLSKRKRKYLNDIRDKS